MQGLDKKQGHPAKKVKLAQLLPQHVELSWGKALRCEYPLTNSTVFVLEICDVELPGKITIKINKDKDINT